MKLGDDMKNKIYKILVFVFYILSLFILLLSTRVGLNYKIYLNTNTSMVLLLLACVFIYINGIILIKKLNYNKKILKINLVIYFIIYTITICSLTLFEEIYGRQGLIIIEWNRELLNMYLKHSFNIIPFNTIKLFIQGYMNGIVSFKNFSVNIIGNVLAFMPYGLFLPLIFKKMKKYYKFLITMVFIVIVIELLQFITMSGACDIDDLILNVLGASIIYFIAKIKCINNFIHKIFLWE